MFGNRRNIELQNLKRFCWLTSAFSTRRHCDQFAVKLQLISFDVVLLNECDRVGFVDRVQRAVRRLRIDGDNFVVDKRLVELAPKSVARLSGQIDPPLERLAN